MDRMDERLRALNRFGLGARIAERLRPSDPRAWLRAQIVPEGALMPATAGVPSLQEIADVLLRQRALGRERDEDERRETQRRLRELVGREARAAMTQRVTSDSPFVERLIAFWSNHLCVSAQANPAVALLAGHYERTAIRPHVLGRFEDMLLASARHPAMLLYLDNARSIGPNSAGARGARRRKRQRGLNENYARELLELHTLGVDGGYTQEDVEQLALVFTGWTVDGLGGPGNAGGRTPGTGTVPGFAFRAVLHEPGTKVVLGQRYRGAGEGEGESVIRDLARHPSTARFIATKLVRHFVGDEPPAAEVERLAGVFRDTGGDLRDVSRALVHLDGAWRGDQRKFRTPQEWLVAVLRAANVREVPPALLDVLRALRQPLWAPPAPKGYDDLARVWADPDSLMNRAEVARSISRRVPRTDFDPARLLDVVDADDGGALERMLDDAAIAPDERLALAIGGPAFQWR